MQSSELLYLIEVIGEMDPIALEHTIVSLHQIQDEHYNTINMNTNDSSLLETSKIILETTRNVIVKQSHTIETQEDNIKRLSEKVSGWQMICCGLMLFIVFAVGTGVSLWLYIG